MRTPRLGGRAVPAATAAMVAARAFSTSISRASCSVMTSSTSARSCSARHAQSQINPADGEIRIIPASSASKCATRTAAKLV